VSAQLSIVEGPGKYKSVYLNGYRIAGIKPWGGGKTILNFDVKEEDIMKALDMCDCPWPCPIKHKKSCDAIKCPWRKSIFRHVSECSDKENAQ
jgi:hypothetical protein